MATIGGLNMNWIDVPVAPIDPNARRRVLRNFGFVMAGAFGLIGGLGLWRGRSFASYLLALAVAFLLAGLLAPRSLNAIERGWMKLAGVLSAVMTRVILGLSFVLVITPVGLVRRLVVGDSLGLRPDREAASYWIKTEKDGPASRPDKPY